MRDALTLGEPETLAAGVSVALPVAVKVGEMLVEPEVDNEAVTLRPDVGLTDGEPI